MNLPYHLLCLVLLFASHRVIAQDATLIQSVQIINVETGRLEAAQDALLENVKIQ